MVFGKLVATCRRMTLDTYFKPDTNTNSKCKDLNIRSETVNFLEEYIRGKFLDNGIGNVSIYHHTVHLKYLRIFGVNYTLVELKNPILQ